MFFFQELTLQINHLTDEAKNRRNALDTEATETLTAQVMYCVKYNHLFCV